MPEATAYADSSFLVSLYRKDQNQFAAEQIIRRRTTPVYFSPLNRVELRNALRNLAARGEIATQDCRVAFEQIEDDLKSGLLRHLAVNWTETFRVAERLSEKHPSELGQRTIDLLHVAIALDTKVQEFLSFDQRQRRLAKAAGLKVKP